MENSSIDFSIWNPVIAGHDTLINVQTLWSIDDLFDSADILKIKSRVEQEERDRQ